VPRTFELGEAFQFDWSEEPLVVGGILSCVTLRTVGFRRARMAFVISRSDVRFVSAAPKIKHLRSSACRQVPELCPPRHNYPILRLIGCTTQPTLRRM
jgi:hypothetical protein